MSVTFDGRVISLDGDCGVDEAEALFNLVHRNPGVPVDIGSAGAVHTALWQVLLALSPPVVGQISDPFLVRWIITRIARAEGGNSTSQLAANTPPA